MGTEGKQTWIWIKTASGEQNALLREKRKESMESNVDILFHASLYLFASLSPDWKRKASDTKVKTGAKTRTLEFSCAVPVPVLWRWIQIGMDENCPQGQETGEDGDRERSSTEEREKRKKEH